MGLLNNRKIIVTGAAQGMGKAIAIEAALEGATWVTLVDIKVDAGEAAAAEVRAAGANALFVKTDLSKLDSIINMVQQSVKATGGIDTVINNAGVNDVGATGDVQTLESVSEDAWDLMMDVNVKAIWRLTKLVLPHLKQSTLSPAIVNGASMASTFAYAGLPAYSVCKAAVKMLTQVIAVDLAPFGIRCNAYAPGAIATPMLQESIDSYENRETADACLSGPHLLKRLGEPEEVAKLVCFLASANASFITGATYPIDAGTSAWRGNE